MDDIWDEEANDDEVMRLTTKKHENQIKTESFKLGMELNAEEEMQKGFNSGFETAAKLTKTLGEAKGILTATMVILNVQKMQVPVEISSNIAKIDEKMEDIRISLNSLTEKTCNDLLENAISIRNKYAND
ncbi:Oidioi.mRNA.OKI2018_I69.PAR.g9231.t1.cds [Oikopleura dioica]|uniref:Oidioi.mRNA.OKI2018_I69.PAR.g9231.t1.cds n=1 Tax=Oikopleura dioica TaxID=34765 RepID=A0ABN7RQH5_OIKDI|nr:Oidioi.mRNA.OKI2018_I69.PAR.g9231.t1.cds [Oikopleura dioica]